MEKHVLYLMLQVMQWLDVRLAQLDRAFGYGPKGRGFESSNARIKDWRESSPFIFFSVPQIKATVKGNLILC